MDQSGDHVVSDLALILELLRGDAVVPPIFALAALSLVVISRMRVLS